MTTVTESQLAPHAARAGETLLAIGDETGLAAQMASELGMRCESRATAREGIAHIQRGAPDVVLLEILLPDSDGLAVLDEIRGVAPNLPVIMLSDRVAPRVVVGAMQNGADDFVSRPFDLEELAAAIGRARGRKGREPGDAGPASALVWASTDARMAGVRRVIETAADTDLTVLVRGESGTGKELVARALYEHSARARERFVKVNCAALPHELLESELFGYEKGAFTGADARRLGKFQLADGGTIFLDEISEMDTRLQAKLLQVLQDGQFSRLGGEADLEVNTRVIATTNRELEDAVRSGSFREDLYYRLNVVAIDVPPLRERGADLFRLADHFIARYTREYGKDTSGLSAELRGLMAGYAWPGNVRELENWIKRLVVTGREAPLIEELRERCKDAPRAGASSELDDLASGRMKSLPLRRIAREAAQTAEARLIARVLEHTRWNRREAAEILQISYKALLYKIKDAGLAGTASRQTRYPC